MRKLLTAIALTAISMTVGAAGPVLRPVISAYSVEYGAAHAADTYLTPLRYKGWHLGLGYERMQAMGFDPERWIMQLGVRGVTDRMQNPARNATMWNFEFDGRWAMMRRWRDVLTPGLTLAVGPGTQVRAGALWLSRNGNNPASAKGAWTVDAAAMAAYNMRIGRLPLTVRYECTLPVGGVFFAPEYGELYYELWLGNHSGVVSGAFWNKYFRLDNYLTVDVRLRGTVVRLGYRADIISTKAHDVVSRRITHALTVGVATEWISLAAHGKTLSKDARVISALY